MFGFYPVTLVSIPLLVCGCPQVVDRPTTHSTRPLFKSAWGFIPNTLAREVYVVIFVPVARFSPSPDDRGGPLHRVVLFLSYSTFRRRTGPRGEDVSSFFISRTGILQDPNSTDHSCVLA